MFSNLSPGALGLSLDHPSAIDLEGFMGAIHTAGYTDPVKVEPFMKELAEQPVDDVLADISGRVDRAVSGSSAAA